MKKQQKFKFVFEKISGSDPFHPMHDSLSRKIETMQQKGTEVVTPAKEPVKVNIEITSSSYIHLNKTAVMSY
jgi:hypothetical protein